MVATQTSSWSVLYIHPDTRMEMDALIPIGMVGLANSVPGQVLGRLWSEVSDEEIAAARVVALDLHWFWSMRSFVALTQRIRRVAPTTPIVTGGYTATAFGPRLIAKGLADYVVLGDAERAFPELVTRLLSGERDVRGLANVVTREESNPRVVSATAEDLERANLRDFGFMPALNDFVNHVQRVVPTWNYSLSMFPYVPVLRGCGMRESYDPCGRCLGNREKHYGFASRGPIVRPGWAVQRDLDEFEKRGYGFVSVLSDVVGILGPRITRETFSKRRTQKIYYALWKLPKPDALGHFLDSFSGGHIEMSDTCGSLASLMSPQAEDVMRAFARDGRYHVTLYVDVAQHIGDGAIYRRIMSLRRIFPFDVSSMSYWFTVVPPHRPTPTTFASEDAFQMAVGYRTGSADIRVLHTLLTLDHPLVGPAFTAIRAAATARSLAMLSPGYVAARGVFARTVGRVGGAAAG